MKMKNKLLTILGKICRPKEYKRENVSARAMRALSPLTDVDQNADNLENIEVVRQVLSAEEIEFEEHFDDNAYSFLFNCAAKDNAIQFRVSVDLELVQGACVCRIVVIFPFIADPDFRFPLCEKILELNYNKRYGCLHYDARDNELSYRYSFVSHQHINADNFLYVLQAVLSSVAVNYEDLRRYAYGRFSAQQRKNIICSCQRHIIELTNMDI